MNNRTRIRQTPRNVNDVEVCYSNTDNVESHSEKRKVAACSSRDDLCKLGNTVSIVNGLDRGNENKRSPGWLVGLVKCDSPQNSWVPSELEVETVDDRRRVLYYDDAGSETTTNSSTRKTETFILVGYKRFVRSIASPGHVTDPRASGLGRSGRRIHF
jgi:hypothetical protein